jgi:hypothetical protein
MRRFVLFVVLLVIYFPVWRDSEEGPLAPNTAYISPYAYVVFLGVNVSYELRSLDIQKADLRLGIAVSPILHRYRRHSILYRRLPLSKTGDLVCFTSRFGVSRSDIRERAVCVLSYALTGVAPNILPFDYRSAQSTRRFLPLGGWVFASKRM